MKSKEAAHWRREAESAHAITVALREELERAKSGALVEIRLRENADTRDNVIAGLQRSGIEMADRIAMLEAELAKVK